MPLSWVTWPHLAKYSHQVIIPKLKKFKGHNRYLKLLLSLRNLFALRSSLGVCEKQDGKQLCKAGYKGKRCKLTDEQYKETEDEFREDIKRRAERERKIKIEIYFIILFLFMITKLI